MVGHQVLALAIGVRVPASELIKNRFLSDFSLLDTDFMTKYVKDKK